MQIEYAKCISAQLFSDQGILSGCYCRRPVEDLQFPPKIHAALPLIHIDYEIEITNGLSNITLQQKYLNPTQKFLQVEFKFPIDPNASIYRYTAQFGKNRIEGIVKQKQQAKKEYQQAISSGKQASYAQIDPNSKDIMNMQIGNIAPGQQVKITISYLQELNIEQNTFYQFHLPSTISPRYMDKHIGKRYNPDIKQASGNYTWNFKITLQTSRKIIFQQSKSHKLQVLNHNEQGNQMVLVLAQEQIPKKDFQFLFTTEDFHLPNYVLGRTDISTTVMISFIPKFCQLSVDDAMKASLSKKSLQTDINAAKGQYIFLLDRSGSMSGERISKAKQALILFLRSLPQNTYFNIVSFGSSSEKMFKESVKFDKKNLQNAIGKISKMNADMGGTQIFNCLHNELIKKVIEGYPKQIFILTDGGVSNTQGVISLVQKNIKYSRCHAIGIGNGCSEALVKGCAEKGKGKYIFISDNQNPSQKIIGLLEQTLTPVIDNVKLDYDKKIVSSIVPNPTSIPYILKNEVVNFYVTINGQLEKKTNFTFSYKDSMNNVFYKSEIQVDPQSQNMPFVDKMAQNKIIKNLQTAFKNNFPVQDFMYFVKAPKDKKQQAIKHSVKHQILSQFTAFICVSKQIVDGKYQQIQDKGKQKINIQNILPIQYESQKLQMLQLKCDQMINSSINFSNSSRGGGMIKSMAPKRKIMMERSQKSSGLSIGSALGAIGSSIAEGLSGLFKGKSKQTENQLQSRSYQLPKISLQSQSAIIPNPPALISMKMQMAMQDQQQAYYDFGIQENLQINNYLCKMSSEKQQIKTQPLKQQFNEQKKKKKKANIKSEKKEEKQKQKCKQQKSVKKNIDINNIISQQNIDGSFDSIKLIQTLISREQYNLAIEQSKGENILAIDIIISYLVGKWIQKYHPQKQYGLIVKKIYSFIKKSNKLEELKFLDKYIV